MNNSKKVQNCIYLATIVIALMVIIILGAGYYKNEQLENLENGNKEASQVATLEHKEDKVVVTVNTETIEDGLNDMGFLVTQEYYFTMVETYTKDKKVLKFFNATSQLAYSYEGSVTAGVDFESIKVKRDDENKVIMVEVPEAKIQTVIIDKDSFKAYSEKESIWNKFKMEDYNMSLAEFEKAAKEKAQKNGVLDRAQEQAEALIVNFIRNQQGISDYKIECERKKI